MFLMVAPTVMVEPIPAALGAVTPLTVKSGPTETATLRMLLSETASMTVLVALAWPMMWKLPTDAGGQQHAGLGRDRPSEGQIPEPRGCPRRVSTGSRMASVDM